MQYKSIDIFCHVVDNFGDIGFVYRFAREFKQAFPAVQIRVFVDDLQTFKEICSAIDPNRFSQYHANIEYIDSTKLSIAYINHMAIADVLIESFACFIPEPILKKADSRGRILINLEHLSAEAWVEEYHTLTSLIPYQHLKKYFYMPGFTRKTGGVLTDQRIERVRRSIAPHRTACIRGVLKKYAVTIDEHTLTGTIFSYLHGFDTLLSELAALEKQTVLLVFGTKSSESMIAAIEHLGGHVITPEQYQYQQIAIIVLPLMPQARYDTLLCCVDFNIVRGEDSLVRALMAGRPFIWHAYLQEERYQLVKVAALLKQFEPYFEKQEIFISYSDLCMAFNDTPDENKQQCSGEHYSLFFKNLLKIEHATEAMSYFTTRNCPMIKKFARFLEQL